MNWKSRNDNEAITGGLIHRWFGAPKWKRGFLMLEILGMLMA